jgi:hypothetical protein
MSDEPEKPGGGPSPADDAAVDSERPTVSPPFDPVQYAREQLASAPPVETSADDPSARLTPTAANKPAMPPAPPNDPRPIPGSTLSLANARVPSNLPPRAGTIPARIESVSEMNAVDREWADMEIATRPPPADSPSEDPVLEVGAQTPLDLDDLDEHGVETVRRPVPEEPVKPREVEMTDRVSLGDYSGALEIAERILNDNPQDPSAKSCAEQCRTVLRQMYGARIGPLERVPVVMVPRDQLRWLSIDHKAGFVLSLVDGVSSLEMIIDVSGMPELDTLRILSELAQQRIISLR